MQAILRGEPISVGSTSMRRKTGVGNLSVRQRLGILGGIVVLMVLLAVGLFVVFGAGKAAPVLTPTITPTWTPGPSETFTPEPTETPIPTETRYRNPRPGALRRFWFAWRGSQRPGIHRDRGTPVRFAAG